MEQKLKYGAGELQGRAVAGHQGLGHHILGLSFGGMKSEHQWPGCEMTNAGQRKVSGEKQERTRP